ncbi:MAG: 4Fe-4S ferredoxin, partial [Deltaproteobacteria bacterium]|nr:4Fe-4S ferredoxin [Deltaproteobacteria bacterium]
VMMGCPKFDDVEEYVEKFGEIFRRHEISSITAVIMEVPCCSSLPMVVKKGMQAAGSELPIRQLVISTDGRIIQEKTI